MGLFDGFEAGWNSFVNNEWKSFTESVEHGWEEAKVPIWDRQTTKEVLGEDGADQVQDALNPARWVDNAVDETVPEPLQNATKKALPIVAIGAAALLLIAALK